ncbi:MAG TPA: hypothetical protein VNN62_27680 [Methylomirabilota bacterium]|jgi:hypothetical protein|nr:hypothetical protein [Methylomirabilota bacterium]
MIDHEESQESISLAEIIPVQYSDPVAVRIQSSGEYRLLWAILEDAIDCYFRYADQSSATAQEQFREAEEWIESSEEEWLCSFNSICRHFQIDPGYLRSGLRARLAAKHTGLTAAAVRQAA